VAGSVPKNAAFFGSGGNVEHGDQDNQRSALTPENASCPASRSAVEGVSKNVALMHRFSSQSSGHRPIERNSQERLEFSARKRRAVKGIGISDEASGLRHHTVIF